MMNRSPIRRGLAALERAERLGGTSGWYALQAAIAACHARALTADATDWRRIVALYDRLAARAPSPVVELNRAVALSMLATPFLLALHDRVLLPRLGAAEKPAHEVPKESKVIVAGLGGAVFAFLKGSVFPVYTESPMSVQPLVMVLLGGVSIFGGKGTLIGVGLSVLIVLCLRNGMGLLSITGNTQTMVIGIILILSVLTPNLAQDAQAFWKRRQREAAAFIKT